MKTSINALHHQQNDWLRELQFYNEELSILTKRLEEVVTKNTSQDVRAMVEHFQNRFIILKNSCDDLRKENSARLNRLDEVAKVRAEHIDEKFVSEDDEMVDKMKAFVSSFQDTRTELNRFLSRTM